MTGWHSFKGKSRLGRLLEANYHQIFGHHCIHQDSGHHQTQTYTLNGINFWGSSLRMGGFFYFIYLFIYLFIDWKTYYQGPLWETIISISIPRTRHYLLHSIGTPKICINSFGLPAWVSFRGLHHQQSLDWCMINNTTTWGANHHLHLQGYRCACWSKTSLHRRTILQHTHPIDTSFVDGTWLEFIISRSPLEGKRPHCHF